MGRKPNPLILEFFERGPKLEDASNRYQHTCKKCGEKFPKGRIDSLTNHLVKRCPGISLRDRQKALLQLNDLPDLADSARAQHQSQSQNAEAPQIALPPVANRDWSALETLAEVSRQIDMGEKQNDRSVHNTSAHSRSSEPSRMDRLELQEQYTLDNPPVSYEQRVQREKKALHQKIAPRRDSEATLPPANFRHLSGSRSASPNLTSIAVAAQAAAGARFVPHMVDPQLLAQDMNVPMDMTDMTDAKAMAQLSQANASMSNNFFGPAGDQQGWQLPILEGPGGNMYPGPEDVQQEMGPQHAPRSDTLSHIGMNQFNQGMTTEFSAEWGNGQKPTRPKVRGKFTDDRRKEVQVVRKKGACIRCRMLKKPCSDGTPCDTCRNVESARLWKQPCVRTRLSDKLDMYAAGLHAVLAYHKVNRAKAQVKFVSSPRPIDVSHYPDTTVFATFKGLESQEATAAGNIDPSLNLNFGGVSTHRMLDNDSDDLPMKLEAYMKRMASEFYRREPSRFMNVVLNTAQKSSLEKDDTLLMKALELWSLVHIFVDDQLRWIITERSSIEDDAGEGKRIEHCEDDNAYTLICQQLSAAAEKKAAQICKASFSELERRLLHKSSNYNFELFLVGLILLNCIEKSTWFFKCWEQDNFTPAWPLDKKPAYYASKGDEVIDLIEMLLRVRHIPPKTYTRTDGILASDDEVARTFFEKAQISYAEVFDKQNNHVFNPANSRSYELRFCSRLLLPIN